MEGVVEFEARTDTQRPRFAGTIALNTNSFTILCVQKTVTTTSALATATRAPEDLQSAGSGLFAVLGLLEAMVNSDRAGDDDGRLIVTLRETTASASIAKDFSSGCIRFVILNPGRYLHGGSSLSLILCPHLQRTTLIMSLHSHINIILLLIFSN